MRSFVKPLHRRLLIADLIDEFQLDGLPARKDAAVGQPGNGLGGDSCGDGLTRPRNQALESCTISSATARALSSVGSKGWARL